MGTLFDEVRSRVTALDAARMYGLEFDRAGRRARCIWHSPDRHPSLSFKGGYCHCFSCGGGGSTIDLTAKLFGLSALDAAKRLNEDFRLGLDAAPARRSNAPTLFERKQVFSQWRRAEMEKREQAISAAIQALSRFPCSDETWENPGFIASLRALARAQDELGRLDSMTFDEVGR